MSVLDRYSRQLVRQREEAVREPDPVQAHLDQLARTRLQRRLGLPVSPTAPAHVEQPIAAPAARLETPTRDYPAAHMSAPQSPPGDEQLAAEVVALHAEIEALKAALAARPTQREHVFEVQRGPDGRIARVTARPSNRQEAGST